MINAKIVIDNVNWEKKLKKIELFFNKVLESFPKKYQFGRKKVVLTVLLSGNKKIKQLNKKFRKKNKPTDVLSFPFFSQYKFKLNREKNMYIGDIAICYDIINIRSKKTNFFLEFDKVWVHGLLHLVGYKHTKNKDYFTMNTIEKRIINLIT